MGRLDSKVAHHATPDPGARATGEFLREDVEVHSIPVSVMDQPIDQLVQARAASNEPMDRPYEVQKLGLSPPKT